VKDLESYDSEGVYKQIEEDVKEVLANSEKYSNIPICVLSHLYDKKRSKFIVDLVKQLEAKQTINREIFVFVYEDQKDRYEFLSKFEEVKMIFMVPDEFNSTLVGKRNYIINFAKENGYENIFMIEDDCNNYFLPTLGATNSGVEKNKKHNLCFNSAFLVWEYCIKKFDLKMSAPLIESSFIWVVTPFKNNETVRRGYSCIQNIHLNVKFMSDHDLKYDENSGWEDFDMNLQFTVNKSLPSLIPMGYSTIALKAGLSTIENNNLQLRCERNSNKFVNKWGYPLSKLVNRKGLTNARIDWIRIKKQIKEGVDLKKLIKHNVVDEFFKD